jgi:hypothetical protein
LGDINGDGHADFAMRESGQKYRISLYFGGSVLDTIPDGYVIGDSSGFVFGDRFGCYQRISNVPESNISAGKISDTGDVQIMIGDPSYNDVGRVYSFNGRNGCFDSLAFCHIESLRAGGFYGGQVQVLGDVNGDGYKDFAIGYPTYSSSIKGEVRIYLGESIFDLVPDIILREPPALSGITTSFGQILTPVGDLNNDGLVEFIVGAGRLPLLYFGGNPLDTLPRFILDRVADHFINGGDINADGYNDLLVGRDESPLTGYAYVYYGGPTMDSIRDLEIRELDLPYPASGFGQTVAGLGDVDGNGSNDFAVGSTSNLVEDQDYGFLWVFRGLLPSTDVNDEKRNLPLHFTLEQNYPNPFNAGTTISYSLKKKTSVRLEVFNISGQLVKVLIDQEQPAGNHTISWNGKDSSGKSVASGIFIYRLQASKEIETKKMILIR